MVDKCAPRVKLTTAPSVENACMIKGEKFSPCVGCGYCCTKRACGMSDVDGRGICTSLYWNGQMYRCRLVESNRHYAEWLYIGAGCPSNLNTWRRNVRERF
jgi:hypothetical protein